MKRLGVAAILCIFTYFAVADCPEGFISEYETSETSTATLTDVANGTLVETTEPVATSSFSNCIYDISNSPDTRFEYKPSLEEDFGPDREVVFNETGIEADPDLYTDVDPEVGEYFVLPEDSTKKKEYQYDDESDTEKERSEFRQGTDKAEKGAKDAGKGVGEAGKDAGKSVEHGAEKAGKGAKDAGKATYEGGKDAGKSIGKGVGKGAEKVGEGAKDAGKSVGDVFSSDKKKDNQE